jgi:hypothetical protein
LQAEKHAGKQAGEKQAVINQGVLASGSSAHPKNARDLTLQPVVGIMGTDQSSCFVLSGGINKGGLAGIWKFVGSPGVEDDGFS